MAKSQTQAQKDVDKQRHDLQQGSLEIKALSAQIDKDLKLAQDWFARLEGRVETEVVIADPFPDPEIPQHVFELRLAKPNWILEGRFEVVDHNMTVPSNWQPVLTSNMFVKMSALHALPALYARMQESQDTYISQLRQARAKFQEFARVTRLLNGEGA